MLSLPSLVGLIGQFSFPNIEPLVYFQKIITTSQTTSGYLPSYLKYSSITVFMETAFNFFMAKIFFIISLVLTIFIFYKNNQSKFKTILENSRWERVIYYTFIILFGVWLSKILNPEKVLIWPDYLSIVMLLLSFYFAWLFAVFVNDREDISIDEISNKNRPLVQKKLDYQDLNQLLIILPVLFFISGYLAGFAPLFFVLCFSGLYYAYSARPTRFKIIPIFSSFIISLCALSMVLAGFFIIYPYKDLSLFPTKILVGIVVIYFLSSHIKDLKDLEGDAKSGIKTLPVMLGSLWAPKVVGVLSSLAYLLVPIFLSKIFLVTAIPFAITNYLLINRKPYQEKIVFFNYFIFIIFSFVLIHF
jgi:4-hydroxybenzoate polyprenyltransferase